jgi:hypothetical protein
MKYFCSTTPIEEMLRGANDSDVVSQENGDAQKTWCVSAPADVPKNFKVHATVAEYAEWQAWALKFSKP